jgi:hypothetical protein
LEVPRLPLGLTGLVFFCKDAIMAKDGLLTIVCAAATLVSVLSGARATPPDDKFLSDTLAVQSAMQQAREHLLHNRPLEAVAVLHNELNRINGNPVYLSLLRDAYQAAIKDLRLAHREAEAERYVKWLTILEPKKNLDRLSNSAGPKTKTREEGKGLASQSVSPASVPSKPSVVRASNDEDPFNDSPSSQTQVVKEILRRAEQEFASRRYGEAAKFYEQANNADSQSTDGSRERWAYCKLFHVVEILNQSPGSGSSDADLEKEVADALVLAPRLEYGRQLLNEIHQRRRGPEVVTFEFHDMGKIPEGWFVGETTNFRVYHVQSPDLARKAAEVAEQTRTRMYNKWFGRVAPDWNPKCQIFLYPTAQDYSRATVAPADSPGHSSSISDGGRVVARQIDLHCEDANSLLTAVLPHETTHMVLVGNFGNHVVPRWVDEGIAVLTEPHEKVMRYLIRLPGFRRNRQLMEFRQLVQADNFPDDAFYAESASLVEFLTKQKGPEVFTQFVREGLQDGFDSALQRHYGYQSVTDLEQHWVQYAFGDRTPPITTTSKMR